MARRTTTKTARTNNNNNNKSPIRAYLENELRTAEQRKEWRNILLYTNNAFKVQLTIAPPNERVAGATVSLRICGQAFRNCITIRNPQLLQQFIQAVEWIREKLNSEKGKEIVQFWLENCYDVKRVRRSATSFSELEL